LVRRNVLKVGIAEVFDAKAGNLVSLCSGHCHHAGRVKNIERSAAQAQEARGRK